MGSNFLVKKRKRLIQIAIVVTALGLIYKLGKTITQEEIRTTVEATGPLAPIVFTLIYASTLIVAPISGAPVFFAGFAMFGRTVQFYTYAATLFSAVVNFLVARKWGRKIVTKMVGEKNMQKVDWFGANYGVGTLIFLRIFQGHFTDFISYAYGLTTMNFKTYFLVSALSPAPWLVIWQLFIYEYVENLQDLAFWVVVTTAPLYIITFFFFYKIKKYSEEYNNKVPKKDNK